MSLKITTEQVINEDEFSDLVSKTYGRPYQLQQQGECLGNGSSLHVSVPQPYQHYPKKTDEGNELPDFATWLARNTNKPTPNARMDMYRKYNQEHKGEPGFKPLYISDAKEDLPGGFSYVLWWTREFYPPLQQILNDLHQRGLLTQGKYTIYTSW